MKILNKSVSKRFESFYEDVATHLGMPVQFERKPFKAFGDCQFENGVFLIRLNTDMNRWNFEHTAAHELLHALQIKEKWPRTFRSASLSGESWEAGVGSELGALVLDLYVEERLRELGFDCSYADDTRYKNSKRALQSESAPPLQGPRGCVWTLRYAHLCQTQPQKRLGKLKELYWACAPHIAEKGEELIAILKKHGWSNPDQALASMITIRDSLGLASDQVIIEDVRTGQRF